MRFSRKRRFLAEVSNDIKLTVSIRLRTPHLVRRDHTCLMLVRFQRRENVSYAVCHKPSETNTARNERIMDKHTTSFFDAKSPLAANQRYM